MTGNESHKEPAGKNILLSAECWQGAMKACRFTGKYLYGKDTTVVLFQSYQAPSFESSTMKNLDPILKKIAKEDLTLLKDKLIGEFGVPAERIQKRVVEGESDDLINQISAEFKSNALVIGSDLDDPFRADACGKILRKLIKSAVRPIFLITRSIVVIERKKVVIICDTEDCLSTGFLSFFFTEINPASDILPVIITRKNNEKVMLDPAVRNFFSEKLISSNNINVSFTSTEKLFNERVLGI